MIQSRSKGFTLLEVIIGAIIVGLLSMILVPAVTKYSDQAKEARMQQDLKTLAIAIGDFALRNGVAPSSLDDLAVYDPEKNPSPIAEIPKDPFTEDPYTYTRVVEASGPVLKIASSTGAGLITVIGDHLIPTALGGSATPVSLDGEGGEEEGGGGATGSIEGWVWSVQFRNSGSPFDMVNHTLVTATSAQPNPTPPSGYNLFGTPKAEVKSSIYLDGVYVADVDGNGHFKLDNVPVGTRTVGIFNNMNQAMSLTQSVSVTEGVTATFTADVATVSDPSTGGIDMKVWYQEYTSDQGAFRRVVVTAITVNDPTTQIAPPAGKTNIQWGPYTEGVNYKVYFNGVYRGMTNDVGYIKQASGVPPGTYTLTFKDASGNDIPGSGTITINPGALTSCTPANFDSNWSS